MSVIADKISSDSRNFLAGVKSSTARNDRTLNSAINLSMRLDEKEVELSDKRRKINAESFDAPQQIQDNFDEGYVSGYQFGVTDGLAQGVKLGKDSILNPLDELFKALPVAAVTILAGIPQLTGLLDIFLPNRPEAQANEGTGRDGGFGEGTYGKGRPSDPPQEPVITRPPTGEKRDGDEPPPGVPHSSDPNVYPDGTVLKPGDSVGGDDMQQLQPVSNNYNPDNMGGEDSNTQLLVVRQPIIVTKKEMGNVVNNGSQLAVIVSGDQRRSDFINYAQKIT